MRNFIGCLGLVALMLAGTPVQSQNQTLYRHNWQYGNTTNAVRFNRTSDQPAIVNTKAVPFGNGGSSVATNRENGNVLFYTDGQNVFGINNIVMPNGGGLNANTAGNQPTAITPVPGQTGKFFIFTNNASFTTGGTLSVSVVDMALFGTAAFPSPPFGDVESKNVAVPGLANRAEGMITIPHANRRDFWLITQGVNSQAFDATLINAASYSAGTYTTITSSAASLPTTAAHLAYHQGSRRIAVAPQDASTDAIILIFNDTNGIISFDRTILNTGFASTTDQMIYDIEWSPSGRFLYISRHGEAGITADLHQYDYFNSTVTLASVLPVPVFRSFGVQTAPDNRLYHLYQATSGGNFLLGRIDHPDSLAANAAYNASPLGPLNFDARQFPSFLPIDTVQLDISFTTAGTCETSPTSFFPRVRPGADSLSWSFGDGENGTGWGPLHTYESSGVFNATLRAFYGNQVDSVTQPVQINPFELELQLVQDTTACREEFPPPRGSSSPPEQFEVTVEITGGTPQSIVWSNGDLGATLTPDSAGYYYVVVTDVSGCSAYAGVLVREYNLEDQIYNKWYFGDGAGIDFSTNPPQALDESAMNAPEGCAVVCDRNGQQILYTDGNTVYDRNHAVIATGIGGNPASTQSTVIVPVPGDETLYYIFTTQAINGTDSLKLQYSLFDLKLNSGTGAVVKQNVLMFLRSTERITASGAWLIAHEYGNNTFRAYPISADGVGNPVYSSIGSDHSFTSQANGEGYMKLGPRNNLAVPISTPGTSNKIELFNIDTTGAVTNLRTITLNQTAGQIYGLEFSPSGNKLYATVRLGPSSSELFEYSIDSVQNPHFKQRLPLPLDAGAIQIAPNGQVYVAVNNGGNNTSLGSILVNEDTTAVSGFNPNGFALAPGTVSRLGLPNFAQITPFQPSDPGINVAGLCLGDSTRFSGTPTDQIDEFQWNVTAVGNPAVLAQSTDGSFAFLFASPGNYRVTLRLFNRCGLDTLMTEDFRITTPPADPSGGFVLCHGPVTLDANPTNVPGLTYLWSTGETTETFVMPVQGTKLVDITDAIGCTTEAQFLVADNRPFVDLGPDITICEDNNTPALNVGNPGMTYQWRINGAGASTIATQAVDVTTPGVFTYEVTVTDPLTTCDRTEDKVYTINVSPLFAFTSTNTTACNTNTGTVTLQMNASTPPGGPLYSYFISGPGGVSEQGIDQGSPNTVTVPNVGAGTYSAIVSDQISGCTLSAAVGVTDPPVFTITPTANGVCEPVIYNVTTTATTPLTFTVTNSDTGEVTGPTTSPTANFTTPGLVEGVYLIEVRDNGGCVNTFGPMSVTPAAPADITLVPDLCALTLRAEGGGINTPVWTSDPPGAIAGPSTGVTVINLAANAGAATFTYTGTEPGACPVTETISLNVGNPPNPLLAQTTECAPTATLTATPSGAFTYRWFRNGVFDGALGGNQLLLTENDNGDIFAVTLFEPQSGCTRTSPEHPAAVVGAVDAQLTSTPPCEDDQPFTLTTTSVTPGPVTFAWFRDNTAIPGVTTATTQQTEEGTYRVEVRKATCVANASLQVSRAPIPQGELPNRVVICNDPDNTDPATSEIDLDPGVFQEYEWSKNQLLLNNNERILTADSEGLYEVRLTNNFNCVAVDETEVLNECIPRINAPNVFRPGSKEVNRLQTDLGNTDFWVITKFIQDDKFQIFIYNRWGEMVFNSNDRFFKWNGGYNNNASQPLPPGTYSYLIKYVSAFQPGEGVQEKRGGVALLR
jgi:gliding motility-associated-like protein